ncbi:MAG: heme-binding protein [Planctomycetes bacterium]|nr:heme-binding protein [Planctomycetota bacterium]
MPLALLALAAFAALPFQDPAQPTLRALQPADLAARQAAARTLGDALSTKDTKQFAERLAASARLLPTGSSARARADALLGGNVDPQVQRREAADLLADLTFEPVAEAERPKGVPGFQALDEIEVRSYPAYRMVRTSMKGGSMGAFWPLFRHIESNEIAMTTPVQVDWSDDERRAATMAFLYGAPEIGKTGADGRVEVVDVPATTVVTIGSRGYERPARIEELRARLVAWIAVSPDHEAAGPMRTMVYNSPSVGADRRYFEVQIPLRPRAQSGAAKRQSV